MADITVTWNQAEAGADWSVAGGLITTGSDLETAVIVSLFTDRVLPSDQQPPDGSTDPRGWWGDTYRPEPIGSLLWTLERAVKSNATTLLGTAQAICQQALAWLIADGVAASVAVQTYWISATALGIIVTITEPNGNQVTFNYSWTWQGVG